MGQLSAWQESDDGIGISRTVVLPVAGEPEGVLHLDLDVGVGEVEGHHRARSHTEVG